MMFDSGEEKVLKALPEVISKYQKEFEVIKDRSLDAVDVYEGDGASHEKAMVRVLTPSNKPMVREVEENYSNNYGNSNYPYYGPNSDFNQFTFNQKGTSFVLVIAGVISLVILVTVVTVAILKMLRF